jgi:hypothetical protein
MSKIPYNFSTMVTYTGRNAVELSGISKYNCFATFIQIKEMGYSVNKGAHGYSIFTGFREKEDESNPCKVVKVPTWAKVFAIEDTTAVQDKDFIKWLSENEPVEQNYLVEV